MEIPYDRVFRGKEKALDTIFESGMIVMTCYPHIELNY
jgi:hypothetical protein